jgi:hypothetical protein
MEEYLPEDPKVRWELARKFVEPFGDMDCDTLHECGGILAMADLALSLERHGAPKEPQPGEVYKGKWETYKWDKDLGWQEVRDG